MESFGLFNLLKTMLSSSSGEASAPSGEGENSPSPAPPPEPAGKPQAENPCVGFLERHARLSENISRKTKK